MGRRGESGFTLIELMIVVVILGILAAIAIPNLIAVRTRAKEASLKGNMHSMQLAAEDFYVQNERSYADDPDSVVALLPGGSARFVNPFSLSTGRGVAYEEASWARPIVTTGIPGILAYADSAQAQYQIVGHSLHDELSLELSSGGAHSAPPPVLQ